MTHTETTIAIAWNGVNGSTKYNVYAGTVAGNLTRRGSPTSPYYLIEGLTNNTIYYIEVSAENEAGESDRSQAITVATNESIKPSAPSGLQISTITDNSITVSWNSVSGASGYKVFVGTTDDSMALQGNPTETSYTITALNANTTYHIAVSTQTATNESDQSVPISVITKPSAPTGLVTGTITSTSIVITWTSMGSGVSYHVFVGTTPENMTQHGTPETASYTIAELTPNTDYYIAVSAENASGEGAQSSPIMATTKLQPPGGIITIPQSASNSIQVSWNGVIGAASYKVYRATSAAGSYTNIGTTPGTSFNDTERIVSTVYYYKASAVTSAGVEGDLSDYVTGTILSQGKAILGFLFDDFSVEGTINGTNISVTVPNIVNLTTLAPTIVHNGKSVSPASGVAQDFSVGTPLQYVVTAEDNTTQNYTVTVTVTNTTLATALTWINSNAYSGRTYTIVAQTNESLTARTMTNNYSTAHIILNGGTTEKTISLSGNGSLFTINYGTLTLGNNITLQGHSSNNASLVMLNGSSVNLVMNTGSKIINNTATVDCVSVRATATGGGVNVFDGTFTMNGGTISGNRVVATNSSSSSYTGGTSGDGIRTMGGGVYVGSRSTFIMEDGVISGNSAFSDKFPSAGGGVFVGGNTESDYYGTFTMKGGTISGNTAQSSSVFATSYTYGGGVAAWTYGTFTMQGGTISGNTVTSADNRLGGGVYVRNNNFTKTGGTINGSNASPTSSQNTAKNTDSGHAVYAVVGSTILKRNTTAGTGVSLDSSKTGSSGGWE